MLQLYISHWYGIAGDQSDHHWITHRRYKALLPVTLFIQYLRLRC